MTQITIRHTAGSLENTVNSFAIEDVELSLTFGRDPTAHVCYDPEKEDVVSRQHATLLHNPAEERRFRLCDSSKNGTFVNGKRITEPVDLVVDDIVRFGDGGPEWQFDLDPRPDWATKATRMEMPLAQTRVDAPVVEDATATSAPEAKQGIGRGTVERIIGQQAKAEDSKRRNNLMIMLALVALVGGLLIWQSGEDTGKMSQEIQAKDARLSAEIDELKKQTADNARAAAGNQGPKAVTPRQISDRYADSVVFIEASWKLSHNRTGALVYHQHVTKPSEKQEDNEAAAASADNATGQQQARSLPGYILDQNNQIMPMLTLDDSSGVAIGGAGSGTGFTVTDNGFILTNRHVVASWDTRWSGMQLPGFLFRMNADGKREFIGEIGPEYASRINWVPSHLNNANIPGAAAREFGGRLDYLDVTFRKNKLRIPARTVRIADDSDVALIKIDLASKVGYVDVKDTYDDIAPGDPITVLGYPGMSPNQVVMSDSKDMFNQRSFAQMVPDPTLSTGNIGKIIRSRDELAESEGLAYFSQVGDLYQLTVNSTGPGNSGGPVFDDKGNVIAIFSAGNGTVTFAVPIRHGIELMNVKRVVD